MWAKADEAITVADYLGQWLSHIKSRVRPKTYQGYESLIRCNAIPALGHEPLAALSPLRLQGVYADLLAREKPLSAGSVLNLHLVLTQALGQAVRWGLLPSNPAAGAQPPRPHRPEITGVDPSLASRILAAAVRTRYEVPVAIAIATGMRRGEILGLRWSDLDPDFATAHVRRTIQPTKTGLVFTEPKTRRSRRVVALPTFLLPYLHRQRLDQSRRREALGRRWVDTDLVIDRGNGEALHPDTLSSGWVRFARKAGLPHVRFHDLRHAHATLMLLQGVHPKVVSERLGHASIGITLDTYSHVLPSMQSEAVRAFDELFATPELGVICLPDGPPRP